MSKGGKQNIRDSRFQGQKPEDLDAQKKEIEKEIRRASDPEKIKRLKKLRQDLVKHLKRDARNKQSKARYRHSK